MKIYQIILGALPNYLESCVESVKNYSIKNKIGYEQVFRIPEGISGVKQFGNSKIDTFFYLRTISEWMRLDLLSSEKNILVVDWDIYLYPNFMVPQGRSPVFAKNPMECMIYNGEDLSPFKTIKSLAGDIINSKAGHMVLIEAIRKYLVQNPKFRYKNFYIDTYMHLDNCRLAQQ